MAYSLTSYIISKGIFQFGGCIMGAQVSNSFNLLNALRQLSSKSNGTSFYKSFDKGCAILENSLMNHQ
jgi:hypothetical protein